MDHVQASVLTRHVTGAFQTAASRALWQQDASSACPWCGQDETKAHRFLHCPAFQEIRAQHPVAVDAMEYAFPHWTYCPFAVLPPAVDILTMVFATRPIPKVPLDEALLLRQEGRRELRFYTDGTCRHPTVPFARHAAWSVLLDCSTCDAQRAQAEAFWQATGTVPPCFQVRSCGLVPGKQTVARAEALAALQAVRLAYHAGPIPVHVVTDSAYVVRLLSSLQLGQDVLALGLSANADILGLFREVWFQGVTVSKVKSHQDVCSISDSATRWDALGNSCVDEQCRKALQMDAPVVHDMVNAAAQEHDEQKFQLKAVYHYLLSLNYATNARMNQTQELSPATAVDRPDLQQLLGTASCDSPALLAWIRARQLVEEPPHLPEPLLAVFKTSTWGPLFTWAVWRWSQQVRWGTSPDPDFAGTTTLELFCDFVTRTGLLPPVVVPGPTGGRLCLDFREPAAQLRPTSLRAWLQVFSCAIKFLQRRCKVTLLAGKASRRVVSLQRLGDTQPRSGYTAACFFGDPAATAVLLRQVILHRTTKPLWSFALGNVQHCWQLPDMLRG